MPIEIKSSVVCPFCKEKYDPKLLIDEISLSCGLLCFTCPKCKKDAMYNFIATGTIFVTFQLEN